MLRPIQYILDHADGLAERFVEYEPGEGDERPVEEYLLERAAQTRARLLTGWSALSAVLNDVT